MNAAIQKFITWKFIQPSSTCETNIANERIHSEFESVMFILFTQRFKSPATVANNNRQKNLSPFWKVNDWRLKLMNFGSFNYTDLSFNYRVNIHNSTHSFANEDISNISQGCIDMCVSSNFYVSNSFFVHNSVQNRIHIAIEIRSRYADEKTVAKKKCEPER